MKNMLGFYYDDLNSLRLNSKMNTNTTVALKPNFMSFLLLRAVFHVPFPQSLFK